MRVYMKRIIEIIEFDKKRIDCYLLLISSPLLLTIYWCYGTCEGLLRIIPDIREDPLHDIYGYLWQFIIFFLLAFVIPLLLIRFRFKKPLSLFGFGLGDKKFGMTFVGVAVPLLVVPIIYMASRFPEIRSEYPLAKSLLERRDWILYYELAYVLFYYLAWEFFFRGFLLFGLKEYFGGTNAVLIQTIPSCLMHLGKPESEIFGSILIGILFGVIALRTRSFWYVMMLHALIGVLTDVFVLIQ